MATDTDTTLQELDQDPFDGTLGDEDEEQLGLADLDFVVDLSRPLGGIVPEGLQPFEVTQLRTQMGPSGYTNIRMLATCLRGEGRGRAMEENLSMSPKARFRINEFLDAIGEPNSGATSIKTWLGRRFWADVGHETFDGRAQARVLHYVLGDPIEDESVAPPPQLAAQERPRRRGRRPKLGAEFANDSDDLRTPF